jgi:hypothetical protein
MSLIFRTQVQTAIQNHLETTKRLLDAPHTRKRDAQIKRHLDLIESLLILKPPVQVMDIPQIKSKRRATKAANLPSIVGSLQ